MEDPSNGSQPSFDGAFDRTGSPGKPNSRRGKRRRSGKNRAASAPPAKGQPLVKTGDAERPDTLSAPDNRPAAMRRESASAVARRGWPAASGPQQSSNGPDSAAGSPKPRLQEEASAQPPLAAGATACSTLGSCSPGSCKASTAQRRSSAVAGRAYRCAAPTERSLCCARSRHQHNCRLLIAQPTRPGQFRVVDAFSRIVRLGEGLGSSGRLSDDAMDRAIEALRICASKLSTRNIRRHRLIATEACRAAENGEAFLTRVTAETGLELEIINRETEARLAVSGCSSLSGAKRARSCCSTSAVGRRKSP